MQTSRFHIVFASRIGVEDTRAGIAAGERPRHFMLHVADLVGAGVWEPEKGSAPNTKTISDYILRTPAEVSALAERIADTANDNDIIFCNSEAISIALAERLIKKRKNTILTSMVHNLMRPRIAFLMRFTGTVARHKALYAVSAPLAQALQKRFASGAPEVEHIREQIDDEFFTPGPTAKEKDRPLIIAVGLERRDYITLAEATGDLDADIAISAFSKDAKANAKSIPETLPANMDMRFYEWRDLAQLYRNADLVVVPLLENGYAAGITSILEASASGKPIIASASHGIRGAFADETAICWTPPGDAEALRKEIEALLDNASHRDTLAQKAALAFSAHHSENKLAEAMAERLRQLID